MLILHNIPFKMEIKANMLQLLAGDVVHLPTLKNFAKHDIDLNKNSPG